MKLVLPSAKYKEAYERAVKEVDPQENMSMNHYATPFKEKLQRLEQNRTNPTDGWVHATEYWIIDKQEYCGRISLRHYLNDFLRESYGHIGYDIVPGKRGRGYATKALAMCLKKAKKLGLNEILISCDADNPASRRVIEKNGGILFEQKMYNDKELLRFKITI